MNRIKVAILFGGCSEEHDVSVKSAIEIAANINKEKYEPLYIGITKSGVWKMCENLARNGKTTIAIQLYSRRIKKCTDYLLKRTMNMKSTMLM